MTFKRSLMFIKHFWGHSQTLRNVCKSVDFGQEVSPFNSPPHDLPLAMDFQSAPGDGDLVLVSLS